MANYRLKPLEGESIYKHLRMLAGYCAVQASEDKAPKRKKHLEDMAKKLDSLSNSRTCKELQLYGE
jgi:hypothetical protein